MGLQNTIEFTYMALCLGSTILDSVDMIFLIGKKIKVMKA